MPEGDVIHRAAAALRVLEGERVEAESPHPRGEATGVARAVDRRVLTSVEALGKNLFLHFEGGVTVRSHLRMSGRWRVQPRGSRTAGRPWLILRGADWEAVEWNGPVLAIDTGVRVRLGPDVLGPQTQPDDLVRALRLAGPDRLLGEVLLDQRVISGVGNMWAARALWRAGVSPWLPVRDVSDGELHALAAWLRASMKAAVSGARDRRHAPSVYRRAGRLCPRCGSVIRARGLGDANRTAYWCPGCQRGPAPRGP